MPVKTIKQGGKYRIVESGTGKIAKNKGNSAIDSGGHNSKDKAVKQVQAVNISLRKRKKK